MIKLTKKDLKFTLNFALTCRQVCPNCSIMSLHCVQQFACLHSMRISMWNFKVKTNFAFVVFNHL